MDYRLAPALVITAGADVLMDEGILYGQWCKEAGVEVDHCHYAGDVHGFIEMIDILAVTGQALDRIAATLRRHLRI